MYCPTPSIEEFGFRKADCQTEHFARAEEVLLSIFVEPVSFDREKVLENAELFYFPIVCIGCTGYLVVKATLEIIAFGSYVGSEAHIWAYYQGISMADTSAERH